MKDRLQKLLNSLNARKDGLVTRSTACTEVVELRSINTELDGVNAEIRSVTELLAECDAPPAEPLVSERTAAVSSPIPGVVTAPASGTPELRSAAQADPRGTVEYRTAFMNYARSGEMSPELRAAASTTAADVAAIIPSTIMAEVIARMRSYGQLFSRVRHLSIPGGVKFPISTLKPTATWITEAKRSDNQKLDLSTSVQFSFYGLECRVAVSLLASAVTLELFETTITDVITEAMIHAMEVGIISGTGSGQMLGITVDSRIPAANVVTLKIPDFKLYSAWKSQVFAKMPLTYKAGAVFVMASGTFEGYIDGMVDTTGQPIGRVNYNITEGIQSRFGGREVLQVEDDVVKNFDDAVAGDVVAIYFNPQNYAINSNMEMQLFRFFDQNTNEWVDKAVLIADGKILDPSGVVIIKKGAAA